jgi:hypothetical protein
MGRLVMGVLGVVAYPGRGYHARRPEGAMIVFAFLACGEPEPGVPNQPPPAAVNDPFRRVRPDEIRASFDSAFTRCEGTRWVIAADVAGRVEATHAVLVRTEGDPLAVELDLRRTPQPEGSLWERYDAEVPESAGTCDAEHTATVLEARNTAGELVDCVAFGPGAAGLVAGDHDDRLAAVTRGDWAGCRVR